MRTGLPSIYLAAKVLCKFLFKFGPKLRDKYADKPALIAALDAAEAACNVLRIEAWAVLPKGT